MRRIHYPSGSFSRTIEELTANNEEFTIIIQENYKNKKIIMEKMAVLLSGWKEPHGWLKSVFRTARILYFYMAVATAVTSEQYEIGYENCGDLLISFEPIEAQEASSDSVCTEK